MEKIYYIFPEYVSEIDLETATEQQFIKLINQNKGIVYYSLTNFVAAFNNECISDLGIIKNY